MFAPEDVLALEMIVLRLHMQTPVSMPSMPVPVSMPVSGPVQTLQSPQMQQQQQQQASVLMGHQSSNHAVNHGVHGMNGNAGPSRQNGSNSGMNGNANGGARR